MLSERWIEDDFLTFLCPESVRMLGLVLCSDISDDGLEKWLGQRAAAGKSPLLQLKVHGCPQLRNPDQWTGYVTEVLYTP